VREVLKQYPAEVVRYFLVSSHYRSHINYSEENLQIAHAALQRLYRALRGLSAATPAPDSELERRFHAAMQDDFNTPEALGVLFELARECNRLRDGSPMEAAALGALLRKLGNILGLLQADAETFLRTGVGELDVVRIEALIASRNAARAAKDWAQADRIRSELKAMQVVLEDRDGLTSWRLERD